MKRLLTLSWVCSLGLFCVGCDSAAKDQIVGSDAGASKEEVKAKNDDYMGKMKKAQDDQAKQQAGGPTGQ